MPARSSIDGASRAPESHQRSPNSPCTSPRFVAAHPPVRRVLRSRTTDRPAPHSPSAAAGHPPVSPPTRSFPRGQAPERPARRDHGSISRYQYKVDGLGCVIQLCCVKDPPRRVIDVEELLSACGNPGHGRFWARACAGGKRGWPRRRRRRHYIEGAPYLKHGSLRRLLAGQIDVALKHLPCVAQQAKVFERGAGADCRPCTTFPATPACSQRPRHWWPQADAF